jgi:hypothetical protein
MKNPLYKIMISDKSGNAKINLDLDDVRIDVYQKVGNSYRPICSMDGEEKSTEEKGPFSPYAEFIINCCTDQYEDEKGPVACATFNDRGEECMDEVSKVIISCGL